MNITKILSYAVYPPEGDVYAYVCRLLAQEIDPPSGEPGGLVSDGGVVFVSPLRRAWECVDARGVEVRMMEALREIPFRLETYCLRDAFVQRRSSAVRAAFVESFIADRLLVSRDQLLADSVEIGRAAAENPGARFVSHTFRMKLLQMQQQTGGELFRRPELLRELLSTETHWLAFGETLVLPQPSAMMFG